MRIFAARHTIDSRPPPPSYAHGYVMSIDPGLCDTNGVGILGPRTRFTTDGEIVRWDRFSRLTRYAPPVGPQTADIRTKDRWTNARLIFTTLPAKTGLVVVIVTRAQHSKLGVHVPQKMWNINKYVKDYYALKRGRALGETWQIYDFVRDTMTIIM